MNKFHPTKKGPSRTGYRSEKAMDAIEYDIKNKKLPSYVFKPGAKLLKKVTKHALGMGQPK